MAFFPYIPHPKGLYDPGISFFPQDGTENKMLMKKADEALYRAKEKMGNAFICCSELN